MPVHPLAHLRFEPQDRKINNKLMTYKTKSWAAIYPMDCRYVSVGIDPGQNFGLAIWTPPDELGVMCATLPKQAEKWLYGFLAFKIMELILSGNEKVVVEGAVFKPAKSSGGPLYGEANLAYIRAGFFMGAMKAGCGVLVRPPATIRKAVFGAGTTQASEIWPLLNHNAADAVAMALYAIQQRSFFRYGDPE